MPQLNLGRVTPFNRGEWAASTTYELLDEVQYEGSTYVSINATSYVSSSADRPTSASGQSTFWRRVAAGFEHKGTYNSALAYERDNIVVYGGTSYRATQNAIAGVAPTNTSYWSIFTGGVGVFQGDYNSANPYIFGDIVRYRGSTYRANQVVSATETPTSTPAKWDYISFGFNGPTVTELIPGANVGYETGDIIRFRNSIYIVLNNLNSTNNNPQLNSGDYTTLIEGDNNVGAWASGQTYYPRDIVSYGNAQWRCTAYAVSQADPRTATNFWEKISSGIGGRGSWSASSVEYFVGDVVEHNSGGYLCILDHTSSDAQRPTNTAQTAWQKIVGGFEWQGTWSQGAYDVGSVVEYNQSSWVATRTILASETENPITNTGFDQMVKGFPDTSAITFAIALG